MNSQYAVCSVIGSGRNDERVGRAPLRVAAKRLIIVDAIVNS